MLAVLLLLLSCSGDEARKSERAAKQEKLKAGIEAPAFTLRDLHGKQVGIGDFAGKTILLNFWATWCHPCVTEMPALQRLSQLQDPQLFEVVAISCDAPGSEEQVRKFVAERGLTFRVLLDPKAELPPAYGVTGFPESFFVGPDGRIKQLLDPQTKEPTVRFISSHPWDSPAYVREVAALIGAQK